MFSKVLRKLTAANDVEFCDTCAQVCTAQCRADAALDKARTQATYHLPVIR